MEDAVQSRRALLRQTAEKRSGSPAGATEREFGCSRFAAPEPCPITLKSLDEVYDLRWLDDHALFFERIADVPFYKHSRICKAEVPF
jgi:hypothetical protein